MSRSYTNYRDFTARLRFAPRLPALALGMVLTIASFCAPLSARATSTDDLDIGSPQKAGGTTYQSGTNGTVLEGVTTISGGGADIWGASDQFHFNRGFLTGNGTVIAEVTSVTNTSPWAKSGVMLRNDATAGAAFADVVATPGEGVSFQWRTTAGGTCSYKQVTGVTAPVWVKCQREGTTVTGYYSKNGTTWTSIGSTTLTLASTALAGVAVTAHNASALCASTLTNVAVTPDTDGNYLHTQGNELRNAAGQLVTLRGCNLGGWLVTEAWMNGDQGNSDRYALETLESRFGAAQAASLINAWRDNWFTDRDFDNVKSYSFNLVRVPIDWRNLQDANGNWYLDANGNIDFSRFDWIVQEAAKRGIYVIFDLHVWQGEQNGNITVTENGQPVSLPTNYGSICQSGEPGNTERTNMAALWSAIATHFKGNGTIAGFDLINEPSGSNDNDDAHRAFYTAIRSADPSRVCIAECNTAADFPSQGWTNVMCSGHYPGGNQSDINTLFAILPISTDYSSTIPSFIGEFKTDDVGTDTQDATALTEGMDELGWSWSVWTYKTVNYGGWGLFDYDGSVAYNIATDSAASLLNVWQTRLIAWQNPANPVNYYLESNIIAGLQAGAAYASLPLISGGTYELLNVATQETIDDKGGSAGTAVLQGTALNAYTPTVKWLATLQSDGNWTFANPQGLLLEDYKSGKTSGSVVDNGISTGGKNQEWQLVSLGNGTERLVNAYSGLDLEVKGGATAAGTAIDQSKDVSGRLYQHWTFCPVRPPLVSGTAYEIVNVRSQLTLDSQGGAAGQAVDQSNGYNPANTNAIWRTSSSGGTWTFANAQGLVVEDYGMGTAYGSVVDQAAVTGNSAQAWNAVDLGNNEYQIVNAYSGLVLDVNGGSTSPGGIVDQWGNTNSSNQSWVFAPVTAILP